jgi:tetratricopeptide (TPR) repeat protein
MNKKILVILFFILASCIYGEEIGEVEKILNSQQRGVRLTEDLINICTNQLLIKACIKAIELNPNNTTAYWLLCVGYYGRKEYDLAIKYLSKMIELEPQNAMWYYHNRGLCYQKKKDYDKAIKDYTKAIEISPSFAYGYFALGNVYEEKKIMIKQ